MMASLVRPIAVTKSGCGGQSGAAPMPVDDAFQRKAELMRLVQRDLESARDDLHAAGKALRRRIDERQLVGREAAVMRDLGDERGRGRTAAFQHKGRAVAALSA